MNLLITRKQDYQGSAGAFDRDSDSPLMLLDELYITQLVVDESVTDVSGTTYDVFFLGSGKIFNLY